MIVRIIDDTNFKALLGFAKTSEMLGRGKTEVSAYYDLQAATRCIDFDVLALLHPMGQEALTFQDGIEVVKAFLESKMEEKDG